MAETPESLVFHEPDYLNRAWDDYSLQELGTFVYLLAKRSTHRSNEEKRQKDLYDAQNYLDMMQAQLNELK